jgi:hypothetical protein
MKIVRPYKSAENPYFLVLPVHPVSPWKVWGQFLLVIIPVLGIAAAALAADNYRTHKILEGRAMDARIDRILDEPYQPRIALFLDTLGMYPMDCPKDGEYAP